MTGWRWAVPVVTLALATAGCATAPYGMTAGDADLMTNIQAHSVITRPLDAPTSTALADFAIKLAQQVATSEDNMLVSPLSAELALAMAANGASGQTLAQMEQVLASGLPIADLNAMLSAYVKSLPTSSTAASHLAEAIWCRDAPGVDILPAFLQTNADYYGAGVHRAPFGDATVQDVNDWVTTNTDGMIPEILRTIEPATVLLLLSALAFDARWATPYADYQLHDDTFTAASGRTQTASFMGSEEFAYLDDGLATGFTKPYDGDAYRFVALLPNEGVTVADYLASLTGTGWLKTLSAARQEPVVAYLPQFSFGASMALNGALATLGMPDAFGSGRADFSRMGTANGQPLFLSLVKQNTFIDVTPLGTRAGAATVVAAEAGGAPPSRTVTLDRPFVFAIVDSATNLPLFLGVVNSVTG